MHNCAMDKHSIFASILLCISYLLNFWLEYVAAITATVTFCYILHRWHIMWRDDRRKREKEEEQNKP